MNIKWFEFSKNDVIEALGAEIVLGGEIKRNAVAFWAAPTSADKAAAADELKKWAKQERHKWREERNAYIKSLK